MCVFHNDKIIDQNNIEITISRRQFDKITP